MISRTLLTLATLAVAGSTYALMLRGWRGRMRRQHDLPPPAVPTGTSHVLSPEVQGLYVGTTAASDWLDRIAVHELSHRATGTLQVADDGVHIRRDGLSEVYLPLKDVLDVAIETSLAGKVVTTGMLVITWRLGGHDLATAFRADDPAAHAQLRDALLSLEAA